MRLGVALLLLLLAGSAFAEDRLLPPRSRTFVTTGPEFAEMRKAVYVAAVARDMAATARAGERLLAAVTEEFGTESRETEDALVDMAALRALSGDPAGALEWSRRAVALARKDSVRLVAYSGHDPYYAQRDAVTEPFRQFVRLAHEARGKAADKVDDEAFRALQMVWVNRPAIAGWRSVMREEIPRQDADGIYTQYFWTFEENYGTAAYLLPIAQAALPEILAKGFASQAEIEYLKWLFEFASSAPVDLVEAPEKADLLLPKIYSLEELKRRLTPDEAVVAFLEAENGEIFAYAVTSTGHLFKAVDVISPEIARQIDRIRSSMGVPTPRSAIAVAPPSDSARFGVLEAANEIYNSILKPLEKVIDSRKTIYVLAEGDLANLPFEMLVTKKPAQETGYADAAWLVRRHAVTVLPSLSVLFGNRSDPADLSAASFLAFADPDYRRLKGSRYDRVATADVATLPLLPESGEEARSIASAFAASVVKTGADANETELAKLNVSGELANFSVILFATHGLLPGETEETLRPSLAFAPDESLYFGGILSGTRGHIVSDGLLDEEEISGLKLKDAVVILSACNTAADSSHALDGYAGLSRAFLLAGARTVIVSHWPVNSQAAAALTTAMFADANPGAGVAERLRNAELALIAQGGRFADPAYWAPFTVYGRP